MQPVLLTTIFVFCSWAQNTTQLDILPSTLQNNTSSLWQPAVGAKWQIILNSTLELNSTTTLLPKGVNIFEVDLFDTPKSTVQELRNRGVRVICYFSAGTSEDWRSDFNQFKSEDKGACLPKWVGERYVDIRSPGVWEVMKRRIRMAKEKGCDAIDPDNIDIFTNRPGFTPAITRRDTTAYFRKLAQEARSYGISTGLKNAQSLLRFVARDIQFAVNEECSSSLLERDCDSYRDFLKPRRRGGQTKVSGKPVFHIEYTDESKKNGNVREVAAGQANGASRRRQCLEGNSLGSLFSTTIKAMNLDGWVEYCNGEKAITGTQTAAIIKGLAGECKGR